MNATTQQKPLTTAQQEYLDMLEDYNEATSSGMKGIYHVTNNMTKTYGKTVGTILMDLVRARKILKNIEVSRNAA